MIQKLASAHRRRRQRTRNQEPTRGALTALTRIALKEDGGDYKTLSDQKAHGSASLADASLRRCRRLRARALDGLNAIDRADDASPLTLALRLDAAYTAAKTRVGALDFDDLIAHADFALARAEAGALGAPQARGGFDHI